MKKLSLINIVDEDTFRDEVINDMPESWDVSYEIKDGDFRLSFNEHFIEAVEKRLKELNVRYTILSVQEREYNGYNVTIAEDNQFYYINFNTGLGDGIYDKSEWTLEKALHDQAQIFDESN